MSQKIHFCQVPLPSPRFGKEAKNHFFGKEFLDRLQKFEFKMQKLLENHVENKRLGEFSQYFDLGFC